MSTYRLLAAGRRVVSSLLPVERPPVAARRGALRSELLSAHVGGIYAQNYRIHTCRENNKPLPRAIGSNSGTVFLPVVRRTAPVGELGCRAVDRHRDPPGRPKGHGARADQTLGAHDPLGRRGFREGDWKTVEVFLPSTLTAREVRHDAYSTIRVIATEAGDFVGDIK